MKILSTSLIVAVVAMAVALPSAARAGQGEDWWSGHQRPAPQAAPPSETATLPLAPAAQSPKPSPRRSVAGWKSVVNLIGSLSIVLGLFLLVVWLFRRSTPGSMTILPAEAFAVLGRSSLAGRHSIHLIRCGEKLLLVAATPSGLQTLTEITDSRQVEQLTAACDPRAASTSDPPLGKERRHG